MGSMGTRAPSKAKACVRSGAVGFSEGCGASRVGTPGESVGAGESLAVHPGRAMALEVYKYEIQMVITRDTNLISLRASLRNVV
jgi:hypothetical protein